MEALNFRLNCIIQTQYLGGVKWKPKKIKSSVEN